MMATCTGYVNVDGALRCPVVVMCHAHQCDHKQCFCAEGGRKNTLVSIAGGSDTKGAESI